MTIGCVEALNRWLDRIPRAEVRIGPWSGSPYTLFTYVGLALAVIQAELLVAVSHRSTAVISAVAGGGVASFFVLGMVVKMATGREVFVYYHHAIVTIAVAAAVVAVADEPLLPYLDITVLSVGTAIAAVRIGCLMVGCCHGLPAPIGVCYDETHAAIGFPYWYVGVRLAATQAIESLWVAAVVTAGAAAVLAGARDGAVFAWYLVLYGVGRFFLELARGDARRFFAAGLSQAQLTSLLIVFLVVVGSSVGALPGAWWHRAALALMATASVRIVTRHLAARRPTKGRRTRSGPTRCP